MDFSAPGIASSGLTRCPLRFGHSPRVEFESALGSGAGDGGETDLARTLHAAGTVVIRPLSATAVLDLTDFKRDLSELTDRLGHAQDCL